MTSRHNGRSRLTILESRIENLRLYGVYSVFLSHAWAGVQEYPVTITDSMSHCNRRHEHNKSDSTKGSPKLQKAFQKMRPTSNYVLENVAGTGAGSSSPNNREHNMFINKF